MKKNQPVIIRHMAKSTANKPTGGGAKAGASTTGSNPFPGGNWPSKVPRGKSGGNRGQGTKA